MDRSTRAAALSAALLALAPSAAGAQAKGFVRPNLRLEVGAALPGATYAEDGAGGAVRGGLGPMAGAVAVWQAGERGTAEIGLRASSSAVLVETGGTERDAERALQLDVTGGLGVRLADRVLLRGAAGISMLRGDDAVAPFTRGNDAPWHLAGEGGLVVRLTRTGTFGLALTGQVMRLGAATVDDPVQEGTLTRAMIGVTYGW